MSGGFNPSLRRSDVQISGGAHFLASEHYSVKRSGITLSAALVDADENGDKILAAGTFVAPTSSGDEIGKYGPFDDAATDGREEPDTSTSGYLLESVNLDEGDVITGLIIHGSVLSARVTPSPVPAAVAEAVAGRITFQ